MAPLGLFTTLGGAVGALGAFFGGEQLLKEVKIMGVPLGEEQIRVGPNTNLNLLFVLINRALLYYQHTINWAHGRRDYEKAPANGGTDSTAGFTQKWPTGHLRICRAYFAAVTEDKDGDLEETRQQLGTILEKALLEISHSETV